MSLFYFLTVVQGIVAFALVLVVLMQRSEGGGLGIGGGGSPGGIMSARGAADFLTRVTKWLAIAFVLLAIAIGAVAVGSTTGREIDTSLKDTAAPASAQPDPLAPAQTGTGLDAPVIDAQPSASPEAQQTDDPLAGVAQ